LLLGRRANPALVVYKFWLAIGAFVVLALGNLLKGL
jgi:hypothetical protein